MEKRAIKFLLRGFARRQKSVSRISKSFAKGINVRAPSKALEGYKRKAGRMGPESFFAWLPTIAAEKMLGKERVRNAMWRTVSKPALMADTAAGNVLKKIPGGKRLFTATEKIPWDNKGDFYREIRRSSALAPLVKVRNVAAPVIVGVAFEKGIGKAVNIAKGTSNQEGSPLTKSAFAEKLADKDLREKVASVMLKLHEENKEHEKRACALRLVFKQAELGLCEMPRTHDELLSKVASLVTQDLDVFEKALELSVGQTKLGELDVLSDPGARNAEERFQATIIGDELF